MMRSCVNENTNSRNAEYIQKDLIKQQLKVTMQTTTRGRSFGKNSNSTKAKFSF